MAHPPHGNLLGAQDRVVASQARVVLRHSHKAAVGHAGGIPQAGDPVGTVSQLYPRADLLYNRGFHRGRLTPGHYLEMHTIYLPSGMTQREEGGEWIPTGARGVLTLDTTWTSEDGATSEGAQRYDMALPGSALEFGYDPSGAGSWWAALRERVMELQPHDVSWNLADREAFSEWTEYEIDFQKTGSPRVMDACVYEVPYHHASTHDTDEVTVHAYQTGGGEPLNAPTLKPATSAVDGATYEERRFGSHRMLDVMARQASRLGPHIASWSPWEPDSTTALLQLIGGPVVSSTTWVSFFSGATSWSEDNPGLLVDGAHALLYRLHDGAISGGRGVVPVRVRVNTDFTSGGGSAGRVRLQSSATEWIDIACSDGWNTAYGFLECPVVGDQGEVGILDVFGQTDDGSDTIELLGVEVEFYDL
jgi:hypothetical protein